MRSIEGSLGLLGAMMQCAHQLWSPAIQVVVHAQVEWCAGRGAVVTANVAARSVRDANEHQRLSSSSTPGQSRRTALRQENHVIKDLRSFLSSQLTPHLNKAPQCSIPEPQELVTV